MKRGEAGGAGESQPSRNARLVCKWVLIDAFSPFVCLMEKHFSLNCHSQVCAARMSAIPDKGRKGGRQTGRQAGERSGSLEYSVKEKNGRVVKEEEVQWNRPLQQLACHLKKVSSGAV